MSDILACRIFIQATAVANSKVGNTDASYYCFGPLITPSQSHRYRYRKRKRESANQMNHNSNDHSNSNPSSFKASDLFEHSKIRLWQLFESKYRDLTQQYIQVN